MDEKSLDVDSSETTSEKEKVDEPIKEDEKSSEEAETSEPLAQKLTQDPEILKLIADQVSQKLEEFERKFEEKFLSEDDKEAGVLQELDPNWQPKTWQELLEQGTQHTLKALAKRRDDEFRDQREAAQIYDQQIRELKNEGEEISVATEQKVFRLMLDYGMLDFKKGYDIYQKIAKAQKEGIVEGEKSGLQKKVASQVSSAASKKTEESKSRTYRPGLTLDDAMAEALQELGS